MRPELPAAGESSSVHTRRKLPEAGSANQLPACASGETVMVKLEIRIAQHDPGIERSRPAGGFVERFAVIARDEQRPQPRRRCLAADAIGCSPPSAARRHCHRRR